MIGEATAWARRTRSRRVALLVALSFGCATVRAPASGFAEEVPVKAGRPEPQLELWIESARAITPDESARIAAEARAALERAAAGRQAPDEDAMLVVRAQGVARTSSRRSEQRAAMAGMVVGAVVVVAAAVILWVTSRGEHHGGGAARPARASPERGASKAGGAAAGAARGAASAPRIAATRPAVRPSPRLPAVPLRPVPRPAPWRATAPHGHVGPFVSVEFWYGLHLVPCCAEPAGTPVWEPVPPTSPPTDAVAEGSPRPEEPAPPGEAGAAGAPAGPGEATPLDAIVLAPPPELRVVDRGFFARDETVLELTWVDRRSGAPLRVKRVRGEVDPRDARGVRRLLDAALADEGGWSPAGAQ